MWLLKGCWPSSQYEFIERMWKSRRFIRDWLPLSAKNQTSWPCVNRFVIQNYTEISWNSSHSWVGSFMAASWIAARDACDVPSASMALSKNDSVRWRPSNWWFTSWKYPCGDGCQVPKIEGQYNLWRLKDLGSAAGATHHPSRASGSCPDQDLIWVQQVSGTGEDTCATENFLVLRGFRRWIHAFWLSTITNHKPLQLSKHVHRTSVNWH